VSQSFDLDPVDWVTASSIGPAGDRTFYIQARKDGQHVAVVVEKGQVRALAELAQELLARVGVTVTPDDVSSEQELHGPVQPVWRAGRMSLGSDEPGEVFILEAEELLLDDDEYDDEDEGFEGDAGYDEDEELDEPDLATLRIVMDRDQLIRLAAFAAFAVEHGGRERCQVCEGLRDPKAGCMGCPLTNGSGPKRI
jgi:uncharacterized repeat protein (TIGR03847 family)